MMLYCYRMRRPASYPLRSTVWFRSILPPNALAYESFGSMVLSNAKASHPNLSSGPCHEGDEIAGMHARWDRALVLIIIPPICNPDDGFNY
jgi:hypothetical protein